MGSIQSCQAAIGFRFPLARERCGNCAHVAGKPVTTAAGEKTRWECTRYGFQVMNLSICDRHQPNVKQGGAT